MTQGTPGNGISVAVVGSGAAGLCAAFHLSLDPQKFKFDVFEQQDCVGGTWCYTNATGTNKYGLPIHSSMYKNLKTNLPKEVMAFPNFPFPDCNGESFIYHHDVLDYLKSYAEHFNLLKFIKFHTIIEMISPLKLAEGKVQWNVSALNLVTKEKETIVYDAVMVCNGHYSVPFVPELKGLENFKGLTMHSHDYRDSARFKDMRVVVLGAGASGIDIAIEVCATANQVVLSHNLPVRTCPLPSNLIQEKGIQSVSQSSVTFSDGKEYACDALLICTGYLYTYPFLHSDCHVKVGDQHVSPLFKHLFHIEFPTLAIWAIPKQILPFPIYDQQVIVFLKFLKGLVKLPSKKEMMADTERDLQKRLERGMRPRHAHVMQGDLQWEYDDQLSELGDIPPLPEVTRKLFRYVHAYRKRDVLNYKKAKFRIVEDNDFVEIE